MRAISLFAIVFLSSLCAPCSLAQGQPDLTLTFGTNAVTADGITPGQAAVFFASGLAPDGAQQRIVRWKDVVSDDDRDGRVTLTLNDPVPLVTVWAVVDLTDGRYAVGSPEGFHAHLARLPAGAFRHGSGSSVVDLFGFDHPVLDLLYVHPGRGAWTWIAVDGRLLDRDAGNGITLIAAGDGTPLGDVHGKPPSEFTPGGVLVAIDWYHMDVLATRLDAAVLGGAP